MEDRFKERISAALMGDLLVALARREKIKELFGEMEGWSADQLISDLLDEFERIIERKVQERQGTGARPTGEAATPESQALPAAGDQGPGNEPDLEKQLSFSKLFAQPPGPDQTSFTLAGELAAAAREILGHSFPTDSTGAAEPPLPPPVEASPGEPQPSDQPAQTGSADESPAGGSQAPSESPAQAPVPEVVPAPPPVPSKPAFQKIRYEFTDDDLVYIHGLTVVPDEEPPSSRPFMLEEKGIEDKDFAFAVDHRGLRFYLSKIHARSSNVSKVGRLLLNKQESIIFRGRHEGILNELRLHGVLLPFEFGTVAHGKEDLFAKIDSHLTDLHLGVEDISQTKWWEVDVYALDTRFAQVVASETPSRSHRERSRPNYATSSKLDIKTLEKILGKQKKIAESVHEELSAVADRSDIDVKVTLGGGTSEDWKLILKASYEVPPERLPSFVRVITDIQFRHAMSDIMITLSGEREPFSFQG